MPLKCIGIERLDANPQWHLKPFVLVFFLVEERSTLDLHGISPVFRFSLNKVSG